MTEVGFWHVGEGGAPVLLTQRALPSKKDLESWIASDPPLVARGLHAVREIQKGPIHLRIRPSSCPSQSLWTGHQGTCIRTWLF